MQEEKVFQKKFLQGVLSRRADCWGGAPSCRLATSLASSPMRGPALAWEVHSNHQARKVRRLLFLIPAASCICSLSGPVGLPSRGRAAVAVAPESSSSRRPGGNGILWADGSFSHTLLLLFLPGSPEINVLGTWVSSLELGGYFKPNLQLFFVSVHV